MQYAPRTIAFLTEILHPPLPPDPAPIQQVHNEMFLGGEPAYHSFAVIQGGAMLSNPVSRKEAISSVSFLPDRFQFREELSSLTVEEFAERVRHTCELVCQRLSIQLFTAQQVIIRTLINPRYFQDSRLFLKHGMFGFTDETDSLARDPQLYGIRMVFPPAEDAPNAFSLRLESYNSDPRSLYIENQASYPPASIANGLDSVTENIVGAYDFITSQALGFLARFDVRQDA